MNKAARSILGVVCGWWLLATAGFAAEPTTPAAWIDCPTCRSTGIVACRNPGCVDGTVLCPAPCLKKETGEWIHLKVAGHSDNELWRKFTYPGGGYTAWTQAHVGERIELVDGKYKNMGKCEVCKGTTRVVCPVCHGDPTCKRCKGTGRVPASAAPPVKGPPAALSTFKTRDGAVYHGAVVMRSAAFVLLKTDDGKTVKLATEDLADAKEP